MMKIKSSMCLSGNSNNNKKLTIKATMITIQTKRKDTRFLRGVCEHVPHMLSLGTREVHTFFLCVGEI